jgi:7,8-dihydropterin-6-yl-methyl-4-(beta-D-ribofuranosyl)aminobenzene 5'-phosphate synthase
MRSTQVTGLLPIFGSAWILAGCATTEPPPAPAAPPPRITVLYDAFGRDVSMTKDWGYAALVEINGKRILFDTGDDPGTLAKNVKAKGLDLRRLDRGLVTPPQRPRWRIFLSAQRQPAGQDLRTQGKLWHFWFRPTEQVLSQGRVAAPRDALLRRHAAGDHEIRHRLSQRNIQLIDKTTEVAPGITLIALVSDAPGTKELKELSLAINTPDGIVLVVGCSHPGVETIVAEAAKINPHIHVIAGGFHLLVAQDAAIEKVTAALHETYKVDYIAPGHCTGEPTFAALQKVFGDRYLYAGLGTTLGVGANPRAESDRSAEGDLLSYQTLVAKSDDLKDSGALAVQLAQTQ